MIIESQEQLRRVTEGQPDMLASISSVMRRFEEQEAMLHERIIALGAAKQALRALVESRCRE